MKILDIKEISSVKSEHGLCLSLFLNIDKTHQDNQDIKTVVNHLLNEEERNLSAGHDAAKHLRADFKKIWGFVDAGLQTKNNRGLAIFSNSEMDFFRYFYFRRPVVNRAVFAERFLIRPLIRYLDDNARILAVFIDQARARLIELSEGEISRFLEFQDDVPKKVKAGSHYGLADKRIERHVDWHINNHLKKVARITLEWLMEDNYRWFFLFGQSEEISEFEKLLHPYPKEKLVFDKKLDLLESGKEKYLQTILDTLTEVEKSQHKKLNDELFESFPHRAVTGLKDVSHELERKSVFKLVISNSLSSTYPYCDKCDYKLHEEIICPNCGANLSFIDWEVNNLIIKALSQSSEIHFIDSPSLDSAGGVGALLRFHSDRKAA